MPKTKNSRKTMVNMIFTKIVKRAKYSTRRTEIVVSGKLKMVLKWTATVPFLSPKELSLQDIIICCLEKERPNLKNKKQKQKLAYS